MPCVFCSHHNNSDLDDHNDFRSIAVGHIEKYMRLAIECGGGDKYPRFVVERYNGQTGDMNRIGIYKPKYCPECGEKISD